ncbi:MAG: hypothetical protein BWY99_02055 [Synergistetes bacterium ADurb.BinA166]|nr:MAG: hypothetical protein BWY99_02055 [Synergistetes bacterium ADurb.BinA166]
MFAARLRPCVASLSLARMKGVISLPRTPPDSAARTASSMLREIRAGSSSCSLGIGLATTMPPESPSDHLRRMMRAMSRTSSARSSTGKPPSRT